MNIDSPPDRAAPARPVTTATLKIHELEAFRAVMLRGTATEAAVLMHTTQPVISKLIARFQHSIGIQLFELRKSRLVPTPEAHILFKTIERTYVGLDHVAQAIAELQGGHSGRLIIGSLPSFGMGPLAGITAEFLQAEPNLEVLIETVNSSLIRHSVVSGKVDLGIALKSVDTAGVRAEPLVSVNTVCVMGKGHPLGARREIGVADLRGQPLILPSRDSASRAAIDQVFGEAGITPRVIAETSYAMTMCLLAMQGNGAALVSPFAAMHLRKAGLVVKRFVPRIPVELLLLTALDTSPSRIAARFIERMHRSLDRFEEVWG
ncbi:MULTISPECIES: LysR substrate-binding domain-containing protein [Cupriavidus]|uniref:LysR substrate-binding domain-containing protein n=1 Tax=Cupriavidus TaxID=106589 RepID=UPI000363B23E|nr:MULTISPECIES: LysR substrate-binding domain-containing protein [Cupriavidus]